MNIPISTDDWDELLKRKGRLELENIALKRRIIELERQISESRDALVQPES